MHFVGGNALEMQFVRPTEPQFYFYVSTYILSTQFGKAE